MPAEVRIGAEREPAAATATARAAPGRGPAGDLAGQVLALQRTAGNAAVNRILARLTPPTRVLARCQGRCTCGGGCGAHREEEEEGPEGFSALRRAVAARRTLQRSIGVVDPGANIPNPGGTGVVQSNATTVEGYLRDLCPSGGVTVDSGTGAVGLAAGECTHLSILGVSMPSPAESSATATGCSCLCDMIGSSHAWKIQVDDVQWPHTDFDDHDAAVGRTAGGTGGKVTAPSPNSTKLWGTATADGTPMDIPGWLVLGHELCGHGWLGDRGAHAGDETARRGEGGHQDTIARENLIRGEHGIRARGGFKDPNCGESYYRDKAKPGTVNWSQYRARCIAWRQDYNRRNKTKYTIADKIP